jgi:hypothetical protein
MSVIGAMLIGAVLITAGSTIIAVFVGPGQERVVSMASYLLHVNGACYMVLGVLFVLRGALQGLGYTFVPTLTGAIELVMRVGAAVVLGAAFGFSGVVWGNPLAWLGALVVLVPAYLRAKRRFAAMPGARGGAVPGLVVLEGPIEGSVVIDALVRVPDGGASVALGGTTRGVHEPVDREPVGCGAHGR